jgi:Concanavalin A-like lectin/glucanases superfamily
MVVTHNFKLPAKPSLPLILTLPLPLALILFIIILPRFREYSGRSQRLWLSLRPIMTTATRVFSRLQLCAGLLWITALAAMAADSVTITKQPKGQTVLEQSDAVFSVRAILVDGPSNITYQWFRNGSSVAGATSETLTLPKVAAADGGAKFYAIAANANGSSTSAVAALTVVTPATALTHRYSFKSDATDSVGHANGTLEGTAKVSDGKVLLDGTRGTYVNLPGGLIAGNDAVTFEFWADIGANRTWARVFDQGTINGNSGGYDFYFCPHAGTNEYRLTIMDPQPRERQVRIMENIDNRPNLHVACVVDPGTGFMGIYTNGVLANSRKDLTSLSSVGTNVFFLGKSLFAGDPAFNGAIDEFRIYKVALSPELIAASYKNGPDAAIPAK